MYYLYLLLFYGTQLVLDLFFMIFFWECRCQFKTLNKASSVVTILDMLHHLAIKVGDVTAATQMVWVVVELHLLVCVALLEVILCSSRQNSCLRSFQAAVIAAEALTIDIIVVVIAIVRYCKDCLLFSILSVIFIFIFPKSQIVTLNITIFNSIQR